MGDQLIHPKPLIVKFNLKKKPSKVKKKPSEVKNKPSKVNKIPREVTKPMKKKKMIHMGEKDFPGEKSARRSSRKTG
jgi:preprotein translocase subunit Sec63